MIQLRTNWPTVLPCQVTSPEAKVTLHREFPAAEMAVDGTDISFNATKGFTIHRPRPHHAGALYCVASLGGLRQSSTKYMLIYVHCGCKDDKNTTVLTDAKSMIAGWRLALRSIIPRCCVSSDPMAPPAPTIRASAGSVAVGHNLHVSCFAVGEQDVTVEFTWEYPGQSVQFQRRRFACSYLSG